MHFRTFLLLAATAASGCTYAQTDSITLANVVVTGSRYGSDIRHLPLDVTVVGHDKLTANYNQSVLPTLAQQIPGLFITTRGVLGYGLSTGAAGTMKVRGVGGNADLLVLIDGLPQYAGLYGHPIADAYQTMMADKVEVVNGPAAVIYGSNAMGGVVNVVTRRMEGDGVSTELNFQGGSYGTYSATATNSVRSGKFTSTAAIDYEHTDGHRPNSAFSQTNGFLKLGYELTPHWQLDGNIDIAYQESSNPGPASAPLTDNDMMITRGMTALSLTNDYGKSTGALRAFYNWGHHHINDGYTQGQAERTVFYMHDDRMGGFSAYQSFSLVRGNRVTLGTDFQHFGGHAFQRSRSNGQETDITRRYVNDIAGYIDIRQEIFSFMTADMGVRLDHHSVTGNQWIPQGGLTFRLPHSMELKAIVGKGYRNPTIREMYMYRPANADLQPERLMNYEIAVRQRLLEGRLGYGVNLFYLKADNLISTEMRDGRPLNVNTGATENSGIELMADYMVTPNIALNANYSYLHTSAIITAAPKNKLFIGADCRISKLRINTGLHWIDGLHTLAQANSPTQNYWLWNLTASYGLAKGMTLFVKGENLLAQRYEVNEGFYLPRATVMGGIDIFF